MAQWNNLDTLQAYQAMKNENYTVDLTEAMAGEAGARRVEEYQVPMAAGLAYNYAAKQVNEKVLGQLCSLAKECGLAEKFEELYNGAVINTGEKRLVLHQLTRGQLGKDVVCDGVNKRAFYLEQQKKIAEFAKKVHSGEIVNEKGEKFRTVAKHIVRTAAHKHSRTL